MKYLIILALLLGACSSPEKQPSEAEHLARLKAELLILKKKLKYKEAGLDESKVDIEKYFKVPVRKEGERCSEIFHDVGKCGPMLYCRKVYSNKDIGQCWPLRTKREWE